MSKIGRSIAPERVIERRKALGLSQAVLAERIGVKQQSIGAIERGNVQRPTILHELARALQTTPEFLCGADGAMDEEFHHSQPASKPDTVHIPDLAIFGGMGTGGELDIYVDANGNGQPLDTDQVRGYWSLPDYIVRGLGPLQNIYAWEVRGDSMEPTLPGGSVVFVDTAQRTPPPDDIYAINYGDGLMVKRLKLVPRSDRVLIISDNDRYGADDLLRDDVHIWGRIVGWFQWRG